MYRRTLALSLLSLAVLLSQFAHAQANVNESLETAIVYVDGTLGSDSNPGTQALPFQTIGKATSVANTNNRAGVGTHIYINAGAYRESIALGNSTSATSLPITFEGTAKAQVRISGADVWTGWQPYSGNAAIYTHAWPYAWGLCPRATSGPVEQDINLRREMIFVNTIMLTQVLALNQMAPGTFFVDEPNAVVYIYPALKTNISTATVEVSTRGSLFAVYNRTNIVVRGLRFEQSNACRYNDAVMFNNGGNILIESDGFNRNNAGAFGINAVDFFTVRNSVSNHNGERGFKSYKAKDGVWVNDEADYNNWRGAQGGIYGWAGGGFYFYDQHNNTISNIRVFYNPSHGVHWDTDIANVSARSLIASYNLRGGLVMEKAEGPVAITNSHVCFNSPLLGFTDGGMMVRASNFVSLTGNTFANNFVDQAAFIGIIGGSPVNFSNYETGQNYSQVNANIILKYNTIVGLPGEQLFYDFDQSGPAWTDFLSTLTSDHNTWWNGTDAQPFTIPEPAWFTKTDWPSWLTMSGQDTHSKFVAPTSDPTIPCQVTADGPDFWFINFETGAVTVAPGSPVNLTMFLIPLGGFNGLTSFAAYGIDQIPGATGSWSQTSLTGSGTSLYTITTSTSTPVGNYPVTLTAVSGNMTRTLTAWVSVAVPTPPTVAKNK
jgi:hypothetical protein